MSIGPGLTFRFLFVAKRGFILVLQSLFFSTINKLGPHPPAVYEG